MSIEQDLRERAGNACEFCGATDALQTVDVGPDPDGTAATAVLACPACAGQVPGTAGLDPNHLRCLNESAWSQVPAVQVAAYRLLANMPDESWARDLLDMLYLDDETLSWAKAGLGSDAGDEAGVVHKDTHGAILNAGDTVTLIKDLKVKGAGFTAKRGTAVRNIGLVADNPAQIEGRVNDQRIVILTEFVKKA